MSPANDVSVQWIIIGGLALAALALCAAWRKALSRANALQAQLDEFDSQPGEQEFRVGMFDCIWYPRIEFDKKTKKILKRTPGLPACGADAVVLKHHQESEGWYCEKCGKKYPEFADASIRDSIVKKAVDWFQERNPGAS